MQQTVAYWDDWNTAHIGRHDVTTEEVDEVLANPLSRMIDNPSPTSNRPAVFEHTAAGRPLLIAYDVLDEDVPRRIYPITAYEPEP